VINAGEDIRGGLQTDDYSRLAGGAGEAAGTLANFLIPAALIGAKMRGGRPMTMEGPMPEAPTPPMPQRFAEVISPDIPVTESQAVNLRRRAQDLGKLSDRLAIQAERLQGESKLNALTQIDNLDKTISNIRRSLAESEFGIEGTKGMDYDAPGHWKFENWQWKYKGPGSK